MSLLHLLQHRYLLFGVLLLVARTGTAFLLVNRQESKTPISLSPSDDIPLILKGSTGGVYQFAPGHYSFTRAVISTNVTLLGGPGVVISCNGQAGPAFEVKGTGTSISSILIQDCVSSDNGGAILVDKEAQVTISEVIVKTSSAQKYGGCIAVAGGKLTLANSTFVSCLSQSKDFGGGAIAAFNGAIVSISNTVVVGSSAAVGGGMIVTGESSVSLRGSAIGGCNASVSGGGIQVLLGSVLKLKNSTVSQNVALAGGGIAVDGDGSVLSLSHSSTISHNAARGLPATGGVSTPCCQDGGGLYLRNSARASLTNSTFLGNSASDFGGGIMAGTDSSFTCDAVTIAKNTASSGGGVWMMVSQKVASTLNQLGNSSLVIANNTAAGAGGVGAGGGLFLGIQDNRAINFTNYFTACLLAPLVVALRADPQGNSALSHGPGVATSPVKLSVANFSVTRFVPGEQRRVDIQVQDGFGDVSSELTSVNPQRTPSATAATALSVLLQMGSGSRFILTEDQTSLNDLWLLDKTDQARYRYNAAINYCSQVLDPSQFVACMPMLNGIAYADALVVPSAPIGITGNMTMSLYSGVDLLSMIQVGIVTVDCPKNHPRTFVGNNVSCPWRICAAGSYWNFDSLSCTLCDQLGPGFNCSVTGQGLSLESVGINSGMWRWDSLATQVVNCPFGPAACPGWPPGRTLEDSDAQCSPGYRGPQCQICRDGWTKSSTTCYKCEEQAFTLIIILLLSIAAVVAVSFYRPVRERFWNWYYGVQGVQIRFTWLTLNAISMLDFLQVASTLFLSVRYTASLAAASAQTQAAASASSSDVASALLLNARALVRALGLDCLMGFANAQRVRLLSSPLMPVALAASAIGLLASYDETRDMSWYVYTATLIFQVSYLGVVFFLPDLVRCQAIPMDPVNSTLVLRALGDIRCDSLEYGFTICIFTLSAIFYFLVLPIVALRYVRRYGRESQLILAIAGSKLVQEQWMIDDNQDNFCLCRKATIRHSRSQADTVYEEDILDGWAVAQCTVLSKRALRLLGKEGWEIEVERREAVSQTSGASRTVKLVELDGFDKAQNVDDVADWELEAEEYWLERTSRSIAARMLVQRWEQAKERATVRDIVVGIQPLCYIAHLNFYGFDLAITPWRACMAFAVALGGIQGLTLGAMLAALHCLLLLALRPYMDTGLTIRKALQSGFLALGFSLASFATPNMPLNGTTAPVACVLLVPLVIFVRDVIAVARAPAIGAYQMPALPDLMLDFWTEHRRQERVKFYAGISTELTVMGSPVGEHARSFTVPSDVTEGEPSPTSRSLKARSTMAQLVGHLGANRLQGPGTQSTGGGAVAGLSFAFASRRSASAPQEHG